MTDTPVAPSKLDRPEILASLFSPVKLKRPSTPISSRDLEIAVSATGVTLGCRLHVNKPDDPLIIFFHGNGETVANYDDIGQAFNQVGLNILIATYRGYGWSTGEPSVSALFSDNLKILDFITDVSCDCVLNGPLFIMGRSIGSASAIDLVHRRPELVKGLIIDSGFADSLPLAKRLGYDLSGTNITEDDCFNNIPKMREIKAPTLILHGARDQVIPLAEAEKLQAESGARIKQFHVIPGADHNSIIEMAGHLYFEAIKKFTNEVTGRNNWRQRRKQFKNHAE